MKKLLGLLIIILTNSLYGQNVADQPDELLKIDSLIDATNTHLARLKKLRELLVEYKEREVKALKDPNDTDNLLKLVNLAKEILDSINESMLQDIFTPQFLDELKRFSQISAKKNIPQAK